MTIFGDKLYQQRARAAFPILVRQAWAETPITYSDLAEELGMPNPRNLNDVLGAIGSIIQQLSVSWDTKIPPLQFIVHQKRSGVPGDGVAFFTEVTDSFSSFSLKRKRLIVEKYLADVYAFPQWPEVLDALGLSQPERALTKGDMSEVRQGRGGEGEAHLALKEYVASHPEVVGQSASKVAVSIEHELLSGDVVDVVFKSGDLFLAVEVKARNSSDADILRGLFQCVKYRAVAKAEAAVAVSNHEVRAILVLEKMLPVSLRSTRNTIGIEVVDGIVPPANPGQH